MTFTLPDLPYEFNALEPHIDAQTMEIHHDKHHAGYVKKLIAALEGSEFAEKPINEILKNIDSVPEDKRKDYPDENGGFFTRMYDTENAQIYGEFLYAISDVNKDAKKSQEKPAKIKLPKLKKIDGSSEIQSL